MTLKMMLAAASLLLVTPALAEDPIKIGVIRPVHGRLLLDGRVDARRRQARGRRRSTRRAACSAGRSPWSSATTRPRTRSACRSRRSSSTRRRSSPRVGFINTGVALASQRFYQEAKIPVLNNVATGSVITKQFAAPDHEANYVFRNSANDTIQARDDRR